MEFKRSVPLASSADQPAKPDKAGTNTGENLFPRVLRGRPLQQLALPQQFLNAAIQNRVADSADKVVPSNLAEVKAKLKARKQKLG